ncbi:MAG: hypothetical protein Q4G09_07325 [Clostridia bacterium]|nr:hypothetical protein [Clostridia bacterium]
MNKRYKSSNGITLVALVVTIVVLLILAGVSLNLLLGENGIISRAGDAARDTNNSTLKEQVDLAITSSSMQDNYQYNKDNAKTEIEKITGVTVTDNGDGTLIVTKDGITVNVDENGNTTIQGQTGESGGSGGGETPIPTDTESYIGYYADMDGNGTVDGIIYADLAHDKSGIWNNDSFSHYEYTAKTNLKSYYISKTGHSQKWGTGTETITADVITPIKGTTGNDRFYVMALEDFKQEPYNYFYWYYNAYGKLDRTVATGYNDFGQGKINTINMLNDWNNTVKYGEQTTSESGKLYIDLWGAIQDNQYSLVQNENDSVKWFIPSKAEWSAFGDYLYNSLNIDTNNYVNFGLSDWYWSSSQYGTSGAFRAYFGNGYVSYSDVIYGNAVRLGATF